MPMPLAAATPPRGRRRPPPRPPRGPLGWLDAGLDLVDLRRVDWAAPTGPNGPPRNRALRARAAAGHAHGAALTAPWDRLVGGRVAPHASQPLDARQCGRLGAALYQLCFGFAVAWGSACGSLGGLLVGTVTAPLLWRDGGGPSVGASRGALLGAQCGALPGHLAGAALVRALQLPSRLLRSACALGNLALGLPAPAAPADADAGADADADADADGQPAATAGRASAAAAAGQGDGQGDKARPRAAEVDALPPFDLAWMVDTLEAMCRCPLLHEPWVAPCVGEDGITMSRAPLQRWLAARPHDPTSPVTRQPLRYLHRNVLAEQVLALTAQLRRLRDVEAAAPAPGRPATPTPTPGP